MQTQRREGFVKRLIKKSSNIRHFHHHRASKNTVTFHFKLSKPVEDYPGEVMLISGSIPELGNGSLENAARMYFEDTPQGRVWKYDLVVPVKELEHARMDIAGTYEGNPHGNFFTYNYVVKKPEEKGMPAIEKFEAVPRRGVPKSSLLSTNSLGEQAFLNDYTIEHTWSATSAPNSVIISKKDLSSNDSLGSKAEITPVMKGKATTADSSPMSPSRPRATTITTDAIPRLHEVTPSKAVERSVSFNMISERDQEVLDQLKAQLDDKDAKKKGMFSWYKNLKGKDQAEQVSPEIKSKNVYSPETERQQRYIREAAQQVMPTVLANEEEPITIVIEDPLPALPQESEAPVVRSLSPEERKAEEKKIIEKQIGLRRSYDSYQKRSMSEEATETIKTNENFVVPEMVRIEDVEPVTFVAPQLVSSDHERLEHDPLMNAVDPELKEEKFDFNTSIEELEQRVISNLKEAELKRSFSEEAVLPEVPKELDTTSSMQPPMSMEDSLSKFSATPESDEISEDVLLDRIEENTPLLAPADSQLQDIEDSEISGITRSGVIEFSDYAEEPSEVSEAKSLPASFNAESEAPTQSSSWASSIGIDAVLSGKMYRIGKELKQKIFGESGWSNFLQSHKDLQSSIRSFEPVDPIVSGKLHNVHRELTSKVAGKSVEDRNDWLSSRRASSMPTQSVDPIISGRLHNVHRELLSKVAGKSTEARNEWLSRRNSMSSSELVDPVISGKMHRVHMQLKQKLPESGRLVDFFGFVPRAIPFNGINPITSGKMHKVHQEITSKIPATSAIRVTPSLWNSGVPEITIKDESIKSMSVFEEQMEKELIHRKVNKQEEDESTSPVTIAGVSTKDLKTVGFHTVRNDFTPISHSESMIASETMTSPLSVQLFNQSPSGFLIMFSIFVWFLLYSIYFPESMLAEMSPTSSTEVVRAPNKEL